MSDLKHFLLFFRSHFLNAGLFSFFINLSLLAPPLYMLQIFDRVLASRSGETLFMLTLAAVGALAVMLVLDYLRGLLLLGAGVALDRLLGERVLAALIGGASSLPRAQTLHGLRDVATLRSFLGGNGIVALFDAPWLVFFIVLIFFFHPLLGVVALGGALALLALAWASERFNRAALDTVQNQSRQAAHFIDQGVGNAHVLNAMGMTGAFVERWQVRNGAVLDASVTTGRTAGAINSLSRFVRQAIQIAMMGTGAYLVIEQNATPGIMIAATILLGRALAPIESLIGHWNGFVQARSAFGRLKAHFRPQSPAARTRLPAPTGQLAVERVGLAGTAADRPIIRHASFALAAGEALAIVGPSASGKSSLGRLIVGIWAPTTGSVRLDGADVSRIARDEIGPHLGYLPQDVELFPATVSENIARLGAVDAAAVVAAAQRAHAHGMILRLPQGYDTPIGEGGLVLSGGQMQRIGLARALYRAPALVVLDEPNANLDAEGEEGLMQTLRDLRRDGVTVVMITHKPGLLAGMDKVAVMQEGRVELFGPRDEVMARIAPGRAAAEVVHG